MNKTKMIKIDKILEFIRKPVVFVPLFVLFGTGYIFLTHASPNAYITPPTGLALDDASTTEAAITWSATTYPDITGYQIYRNSTLIGSTDQYTTNYLDQNLTPGTTYSYTVEAVDGASSSFASTALSVTTGQTSQLQVITSCGDTQEGNAGAYNGSGNYVLNSNLTTPANFGVCIWATDNNVSIDCQGHTISSPSQSDDDIDVTASNFLLINCNLSSVSGETLGISGSSNGMAADNTLGDTTALDNFADNHNVLFEYNKCPNFCEISNGGDGGGAHNYFGFNNIKNTTPQSQVDGIIGQALDLTSDSYDIADGNTIVGDATAITHQGQDDGIIFGDGDTGTVIVNNNISDVFDAGIEGGAADGDPSLVSTDDLIANNTISYAYTDGIGSYWDTSWDGVTVENNNVSNSGGLFLFYSIPNSGPPTTNPVEFDNNNFLNNTFTNPAGIAPSWFGPIYMNLGNIDSQIGSKYGQNTLTTATNNKFQGNNYNYQNESSTISPSSLVVDGGNNVCVATPGINCLSSAPIISITSPSEGITLSGTTSFSATAQGSGGGGINKVVFSIDGSTIATDSGTLSSYTASWSSPTVADGAHVLKATVTDNAGLTASASLNIYVINGTGCSANPTAPATLTDTDSTPLPSQIDLSWTSGSAASGCTLAGYKLYRNGGSTPIATIPAGTLSYSDTGLILSSYTYQIASYDTAGHVSSLIPTPPLSANLGLTDEPPTVNITSPATNTSVRDTETISVTASDTNTSGTISSVQMTVNGTVVQTLPTSPFNFSLNTLAYKDAGYVIAVKATDNYGNVATTSINLTITNGDLNNDGKINISDLSILASNWNKTGQTYAQGDINGDGKVNIQDLAIMAANWGWSQ